MARVDKSVIEAALYSWTTLNEAIAEFSEDDTIYAMEVENEREEPRTTFLRRLRQRLYAIRAEQIRREMEGEGD